MTLKTIISLFLLVVTACGCSIQPPLHLRQNVEVAVALETKVNLNVMWQVNWEAKWSFRWNTEVLGPVGYTEPASMRVHVYPLDADGNRKDHSVLNFYGTSAEIPVIVGTYDLLFHNNDSEVLLFQTDENEQVHSYTRQISSGLKDSAPVMTSAQKAAAQEGGTKADGDDTKTPAEEPVNLMPDPLFSLFDRGQEISADLSLYEYIDGKYVIHINGELQPSTYIYLIQIHLLNNGDRVIGSEGGAAVTGLASGVNLNTGINSSTTASVPFDVYTDRTLDMMGARMVTFGIPDCNPYDEESVNAANADPEARNFLVLNVTYGNGTWKNVRIDITDKLRALPLGGVIDLELDVEDFPPEGGVESGSGFQALIDGWEEEEGHTTITN